jgi:hypothetical protein
VLTIDTTSFRHAAAQLDPVKYRAAAARQVPKGLAKAGNVVRRYARQGASAHRKYGSGRMSKAIYMRAKGAGLNTEVKVSTGRSHANIILHGARGHSITPKSAEALIITGALAGSFAGRGTGRGSDVLGFAKSARHPGTPADPFFDHAITRAAPEMEGILANIGEQVHLDLAHRLQRRL